MAQALINGKAYSYCDLNINIAGFYVASASKITVEESQEKTNNYGLGTEPESRGRGAKEYTGSIDLSYKDVLRLKNLTPTRSLNDLPLFEVLIIMNNGTNINRIFVRNCEFKKDGLDGSQGDTNLKMTYDIVFAGINYL